nr:hypothetical protein [Prevotella sp.]
MRTYFRRIATLVLLLATFCVAQAQTTIADTELKQLVDIVKRLRTPSEAQQKKAYEAAIKPLADDTRWTPMNELRDENG